MQDDTFEWDDHKADQNWRKHRVDFTDARLAFDDPGQVDEFDEAMDYDEERFKLIGMANGQLLMVIFTYRDERIRIISARKASRQERDDYARQNPTP